MTERRDCAVALWLLVVAVCVAVVMHGRFTADMSAFLPRSSTPAQQILVDQLRDGAVSRLLLIGIEGAPEGALVHASKALADRVAADPSFAYVANGSDKRLAVEGRFLLEHRYLLSPGVKPERFTVAGLRAALAEDLGLLGSPMSSLVNQLLPRDPTGEFLRLLESFQLGGGPEKRDGMWFSKDGTRALLIAQTRAAGFDLDAQEHALQVLHAAFAAIVQEHKLGASRLLVSGPAVFAVASRGAIKEDVSRISLLAIMLVSGLLVFIYRSPRVLLLTLLPVASGVLAGVAAVDVAFGYVHGITLGFGATLLGESVDYAIYLFTATGGDARKADLGWLWRTLRLGVLTSMCGFGVMLLSDFTGLAQLGLLSITGLLVAFLVTRFVLPELVPDGYRIRSATSLGPLLLRAAQWLPQLRYVLLIVSVASIAWLAWQGNRVWNDHLESLSPVPEAEKRLDAELRRDLSAPDMGQLVVIRAGTEQAALEMAERAEKVLETLKAESAVAGFESPARILPSERKQRERQAGLPEAATLRRNLGKAAHGMPFRVESFRPFLDDVARAKQAHLLSRADLKDSGLALRLDSLLAQRRGAWFAMLPLRGSQDTERIQAAAREISDGDVEVRVLDVKHEADSLYLGYRRQALWFAVAGVGAIVLLLLVSLRSVRRSVDVLLPLASAVLVTCALLTAVGQQLTMFHLVGLLLVVGVGSNYTLFFEPQIFSGGDPERTVTSVVLCNVCTVIGFGLLGLARAPVLHAIGGTVAIGAFLNLLFGAMLRRPVTGNEGYRRIATFGQK